MGDTLRVAQEAMSEAKAQEEAAKGAIAELEPKLSAADLVLQARREELEQFCTYNACIFSLLRDRVQEQPQRSSEDPAVDIAGESAVAVEDVVDAACKNETCGLAEDSVAGTACNEASIAAPNKES